MDDQGNVAGDVSTEPRGDTGPADFAKPSAPDGQVTVSKAELDRLTRLEQQYRGSAPLVNAAVKAGIKTVDDLTRITTVMSRARERNIDLESLLGDRRPDPEPASAAFDPDEIVNKVLGTVDQKMAEREYQAAVKTEAGLIREVTDSIAGPKASDEDRLLADAIVNKLVARKTTIYPDGHIMAGQISPLGRADFDQIKSEAQSLWKSVKGKTIADVAKGTVLRDKPEGGGGPSSQNPNEKPKPKTRAEMIERARAIMSGHSDRPLSQA